MQSYFYSAKYFMYSFVLLFSRVFLYCSFYHLPFVTLSTYFHIFIAFHILTCDFTSYMQNSIRFFLDLKMISERSKHRQIISLVFILKCVSKKLLIIFYIFLFLFSKVDLRVRSTSLTQFILIKARK